MPPIVDLSRLGAVITKSLSVLPREGNPAPRIWETPSGMLNAIGLENCGLQSFIDNRVPELATLPTKVLVNVVGDSVEDYATICSKLDPIEAVDGFEINISCPNVKHGCKFSTDAADCERLIKALRPTTKKLLLVKLSPNVTDIGEIARAAVAGGADALSLINTVLGMAIDIKNRRPQIANITGGLSGPVHPAGWRALHLSGGEGVPEDAGRRYRREFARSTMRSGRISSPAPARCRSARPTTSTRISPIASTRSWRRG